MPALSSSPAFEDAASLLGKVVTWFSSWVKRVPGSFADAAAASPAWRSLANAATISLQSLRNLQMHENGYSQRINLTRLGSLSAGCTGGAIISERGDNFRIREKNVGF